METREAAHHLQTIGLRNIKTALAAALCALVYYFFDRSPAFACIGAVFGLGHDMESSKLHGGNRLFGTIIGGVIGMALFWVYLFFYPDGRYTMWLVLLVFIGVVLLIMFCQILWVGGVQPGSVVLFILLFNTPADSYISYALDRIFDTGVGVVVSLFINRFFPRERVEYYLSRLWFRSGGLRRLWTWHRPSGKK